MPPRSKRFLHRIASLLLVAVVATVGTGVARGGELPTLYINYAMNCTFTITNDAGGPVASIAPGAYEIEVSTPTQFAAVDLVGITDDTACMSAAQFQLTGPGVSLFTTLEDGDGNYAVLNATFLPSSTYTAVDLTQPAIATASFSTTASGTPVAPPAPTDPAAGTAASKTTSSADVVGSSTAPAPSFKGTLDATVSAAGKLSLTFGGKNVATLVAGKYTVSIIDRSKKTPFILQELNQPAQTLTPSSFTGKRSVSVTMKAGQWFYYPTFVGKKSYFIVIS
jgi:hypothetical protein